MMNASTAQTDLGTVALSLAHYDVPYLRIRSVDTLPVYPVVQPDVLIRQLASDDRPRLHEALIPLFLRHPEFHHFVPNLAATLDTKSEQTLQHLYTAAVYLQHFWQSTLTLYLGTFARLPNYFGERTFELPPPDVHWGEMGLRLLAARLEKETGDNWLATYEGAFSRFLMQLQLQSASNYS